MPRKGKIPEKTFQLKRMRIEMRIEGKRVEKTHGVRLWRK